MAFVRDPSRSSDECLASCVRRATSSRLRGASCARAPRLIVSRVACHDALGSRALPRARVRARRHTLAAPTASRAAYASRVSSSAERCCARIESRGMEALTKAQRGRPARRASANERGPYIAFRKNDGRRVERFERARAAVSVSKAQIIAEIDADLMREELGAR